MANARTGIPQVNLKDRIAALQQRNTSPSQHGLEATSSSSSVPGRIVMPGSNSLKDKIANFEKKGAVPVPRGRFGESTPVAGDSSLRKRGELYGNRVPELAKSTGEAALLVRKRTVSTHAARSYSISKPLIPTLTGNSPPLTPLQPQLTGDWAGFSEARYPSTFDRVERRTVSDMLPRAATFSDVEVEEPLMESEAEGTGDKKGGAKVVQSALSEVVEKPQIIVEPSPAVSEDSAPVQEVEAHSEQDVTQTQEEAIPETLPSAGLAQETTREQLLATKTEEASEPPVPALDVEQLPSPPLEDEVDDTTPTSSSELLANLADSPSAQTITFPSSSTQSLSPVETPPNDISPPHSAPLSLNTEMGSSSGTEEIFGSSEELQTPSDSMSFQTAESPVDSKVVEDVFASDVGAAVLITEPPQTASAAVARTVLVPAPTRNDPIPATIPLPLVNIESPVDRPLDLPESPLTAKPTPASREFPPHTVVIPSPTPSSPSEKAMFERKNTQKSFHAVVHHKVVESSPVEPAPAMPAVRPLQNKANPIFPSQKKSAQRVVSQAYVEPESTSIGDLASLVADAALLEEALATPAKKPSRIPVRAQSGLPQVRESRSLERPRPAAVIRVDGVEDSAISPPGNSPFSDNRTAANSSSFFTSHLRANSSTGPKSTSPSGHSRGSKYFSGLRRKQSMPGAYPRTSSEMSTDESMLVSTPPSPPLYGYEGSDTSSIRSSSKSLKSPKKSLSRASSWLFRKSSSPSVAEEEERPLPPLPEPQSPSSSAMLSPNSAVEPRLGARPASWVSISSTGSGDAFDSDFFDAFPSVPGSVPTYTAQETTPSLSQPAPRKTRPHAIFEYSSRR